MMLLILISAGLANGDSGDMEESNGRYLIRVAEFEWWEGQRKITPPPPQGNTPRSSHEHPSPDLPGRL
ncbi:hypothetical protein SUGI_0971000 [Cryptomeria japonica]|nr:hypothetical protein SUGI_0971000 [Cryptomeria japonica]